MKIHSLLAGVMLLFTLSAEGQQQRPKIVAEGGTPDDRASARVLYWNTQTDAPAGQFAIDYGRPVWKKEYEDPAKFDAIAHRFWDPAGEFGTLHTINPARLGYISERVPLRGVRTADVGCGGGLLAEGLARAGANVTATANRSTWKRLNGTTA